MERITLSTCTPDYIQGFIRCVETGYNIDPDYKLTFDVRISEASIKVTYVWTVGKTKSNTGDPAWNNSEEIENDGHFRIFKNTSECTFEKLKREVEGAIEEVTKEPFNPLMER